MLECNSMLLFSSPRFCTNAQQYTSRAYFYENNSENGFPTPISATATFAANSTRKERHRCTLIRCSAIELEPTVVNDMPQGWHSPTAYFCPTLAMDAAGALRQ